MIGKRIEFDEATWRAIEAVAEQTRKDLHELAAEAFADLLKKHEQFAGERRASEFEAQDTPMPHSLEDYSLEPLSPQQKAAPQAGPQHF